jgi:biopolymer transport protein TolR
MAASVAESSSAGRHRGRRRAVMSEINVTPFVDVMLVLLIIFMVSAPLLTVGVPVNLPQSQAKSLSQSPDPVTVTINAQGEIYLQDAKISVDDLLQKLKAVTDARGGVSAHVYVKADRDLKYGMVMRLLGRLNAAGYTSVELVTDVDQES